MWSTAGMATDRGTTACAAVQLSSLRSLVGWLFGCCGAAFWVKWRRIWVREEVGWAHANRSYIFQIKGVENLTKMAEKEPRYQVLLVFEKPASPLSTAVSHNGNALTVSRLTLLMR